MDYVWQRDTWVLPSITGPTMSLPTHCLGLSVPLGLCGSRGYDEIIWGPSFGDKSCPNFKEGLLPITDDFIEQETRRRTFWMAFGMCIVAPAHLHRGCFRGHTLNVFL
jgi:hypothetical protein